MEDFEILSLNCSNQAESQNNICNDKLHENLDELIVDIDKVEDLEVLDDILNKMESKMLNNTEVLKCIQKKNSKTKCELDSKKNFLSELDNKTCEMGQKAEGIQNMIDAQHKELVSLQSQQAHFLNQFENAAMKLSKQFENCTHEYASKTLKAALLELRNELDAQIAEYSDVKQIFLHTQRISKKTEPYIETAMKLHVENIIALNSSLKSLMLTEEQLKKKPRSKYLIFERRN